MKKRGDKEMEERLANEDERNKKIKGMQRVSKKKKEKIERKEDGKEER